MKVWILLVAIHSGHTQLSVAPTIEFSTKQKCEQAREIILKEEKEWDLGVLTMTKFKSKCVEIEK
jgi:hypothetical protein